jgi:hypothetical protein
MEFNETYRRQVALLIRTMPSIAAEECFAMKGGTAINLFVRDLPRLSVDIDLTYLPIQPRSQSLAEIEAALLRIGGRIDKALPEVRVTPSRSRETNVTKLIVRRGTEQIKIEVTPVLRGCVFHPGMRDVSPSVEQAFGFAEMRLSRLPISTPERSSRRWTASIRVTSSTSVIFYGTRASTTPCTKLSSSIC